MMTAVFFCRLIGALLVFAVSHLQFSGWQLSLGKGFLIVGLKGGGVEPSTDQVLLDKVGLSVSD